MDFILNKIDKRLDNHRSLDQHVNDLKRKLTELNGVKEDTDSRMNAELQPRKKLKTEFQIWLENVERINGEVQNLNERIGESSTLTRGFHADDVLKRTREVEELIQQGKFQEGLVVDNPQWIGQVLSTTTLSGEGANACVEKIWQCLMDDEVGKIGVWGMGGVGKTSIVKLINNQLLKEMGKFDVVIWTTVSKEMSIAKLQKDIASQIKVTFCGDECETRRAGMLLEALSRKRRPVFILDDLWQEVSLEKVGIPEPSVGNKLVLTTRSFDVCRKMGCRAIKVKPLVEEEAWKLFSEKVGRDILNVPGVEPIAKKIAKRCAGLPLGVITVASCMKGIDDLSEWRNALKELSEHKQSVNELEDEVFQQLRFSYDRLNDLKLQRCFLSCALYPEDWRIKERELVKLWIAEGLVEEMDSRQAEFDKGHAIINRLKNNCLLEDFSELVKKYRLLSDMAYNKRGVKMHGHTRYMACNKRRVKMHDLTRDMALHIKSTKPRFLVKAGMGLREPLNVQEWSEDLEKVSLMRNRMLEVLYPLEMSPPKCPMLTTLLLADCGIKGIPEGFFNHMDGLKILNLSGNPIKSLPNSISNLKNLTELLLAFCKKLDDVPFLSKLRVLKELDLQGTKIKEVPHGLENLLSLKYLNLEHSIIHEIPNGILSKLSCLQYLNVIGTLISGKDVGELKKLEMIKGRFYNFRDLSMYLQACHDGEEPRKYIIHVGKRQSPVSIATKSIKLRDCNISNQIMLPRDIEELYVRNCTFCCHENYPLFSRFVLTSLNTFSSLTSLEIRDVKNMKKLFSPNCMPLKLEVLKISLCVQLEEIIALDFESNERGRATMEFCLLKLKELVLECLPELKSICKVDAVVVCESLKWIDVRDYRKLKRLPFSLPQIRSSSPLSFSIYVTPEEWWKSVEWDDYHAQSLLEPFVTFLST
ncbi:hypothetical protein ES288_A11G333100v1 [Gossypium darwinii]|uniref:Uncharacterized protein n=1 Tax=Gossypium darwinii TaxID=34276 RepID=A0A5D2ETR9_GOSDA|nr:hypothetical protein ES288_A11G333100v1 [Gossypium darwinii]